MIGRTLFGAGWRHELALRLGASEDHIVRVESGVEPAPEAWRGKLIAMAQDFAVRALEVANALLASAANDADVAPPRPPLYA
ncbi:MAG: hypothetical protein JNM59_04685 [Hyphomonadaceae bacterium]|nr:hypothetical protein [Hyphomonadaceae bacterium]